jgi:hypothetical protein
MRVNKWAGQNKQKVEPDFIDIGTWRDSPPTTGA